MGDSSDFERRQIVGARQTGASVIETTTLLGVSRATVSEVMSAYTPSWKDNIGKEKQLAKINTDRKRSSFIEKDCFAKSQHR
jgi:predicted transcriptional regulator